MPSTNVTMNIAKRRTRFDTEQETDQAMTPNNRGCKRCKSVTAQTNITPKDDYAVGL